jgi:spore germination protein
VCSLIVASCFLIGCWDRTEIEEIGFLIGVALDPVEDFQKEMGKIEKEKKRSYHHLINSTYQVAIPSNLIQQEGGGMGDPFFNIETTGMTNFTMLRQIAAKRSRKLNLEHMKNIIINEELVRQEHLLENVLDFFLRDHEMRRRTNVFISKGKATEILQDKLPLEEMPSISIMHIGENEKHVPEMLTQQMLGTIQGFVLEETSFLLPRIVKGDGKDIKIAGAAVFLGKNNQLIGLLGEEDVKGYKLVMGEYGNGVIEAKYEDEPIVLESFAVETLVDYERKKGTDHFNVEIRAEGSLGESWVRNIEINDVKMFEQLGGAFEQEIKSKANDIIKKMQEEFGADVFEFNRKVKQKNNRYWKTVKDDWDGKDGVFSKAEVTVNAKVEIRHYMLNEKLS